jgi:hypothetical protein
VGTRRWLLATYPHHSGGTDPERTRCMARETELVSPRQRVKSDTTKTTAVLLLIAFLAVCALLWFGYEKLKNPADRFASRIYRTASLTTAGISDRC